MQRPGGGDLDRVILDAEAAERGRAEVAEEGGAGLLGLEIPRRSHGDRPGRLAPEGADPGGVQRGLVDERLGRGEPGHLVGKFPTRDLRERKTARGQLDPGEAERAARLGDGRQVVGGAGVHQGVVGQRAGGDDADDLSPHQPLGELGILHLLADGRPLARLDDLGQV